MKKLIVAAIVITALGFLVNAAGKPPSTTTSPAAVAASPGAISVDQRYLNVTRANIPSVAKFTDADLIDLGHTICTDLDGGKDTITEAVSVADHMPPEDAGAFVASAEVSYCPIHLGSTPTTALAVEEETPTTDATSSCDVVREALLTGTTAQIATSLQALKVDKTADATAREYADYYLNRDKTQPDLRSMDITLIRSACS